MLVEKKIQGPIYKNLINYAYTKCDAVMFIVRKDIYINEIRTDNDSLNILQKNMKKYVEDINKYLLKKRHGAYWVYSESGADDELIDVYFYKFNNQLRQLLLENDSIYSWLHPTYPEDIAFFKNGYCWLYSVAHEDMCEIYYETDEEYHELIQLGIEFDEKYILPKSKRYYEDYGLNKNKSDEKNIDTVL